ncbi:MAG: hypothetical protein ACRDHM_02845 [Actinomycetota bacterium]
MLRVVSSAVLIAGLLSPGAAQAQVVGADLSASATVDRTSASVGGDLVLTAGVGNAGPEQATDVVLTIHLAEGLVAQVVEDSPGPCELGRRVACSVGVLPPGGSAEVRLLLGVTEPGSLVATVTADAAQEDTTPGNEQAAGQVASSGIPCDRVGSIEPDDLRAPQGGAVLCGLGGDDTLLGGPRGDDLLGGSGFDALIGDAGRDRLDGGDGIDACTGDPGPGSERACERSVFALAESLPLVEPGAATIGYGYHQSLYRTAIALRPLVSHVVMGSRSRGTGATTSADVVVGSSARVSAPVTGQVVTVKRYLLYCERPDWKVVIKPRNDPTLRVLVLHLGRPSVKNGDEVTAGVSRIGRAPANDWADSQANRYFPERYPHVHVEVERDGASPTPGCSI